VNLHAWPAARIAANRLPGQSLVIQFADDEGLLPTIYDKENCLASIQLISADDAESFTAEDAKRIMLAVRKNVSSHIVVQCMAGVSRSVAVCMALAKIFDWKFEWRPTYNHRVYKMLLAAAGYSPPDEPLVSIAVRVKYDVSNLMAFFLSLQRQRYSNWEAVFFTDGQRLDVRELVASFPGEKVTLMENSEHRGRWGHYYRQAALQQCKGEWIGTNNDDNYLTPGYIEQMVYVGQKHGSDVVTCQMLHRYSAWQVVPAGTDLCAWLARGELVHRVPWEGTGFTADQEYLQALVRASGKQITQINAPLVVKN